MRAAWRFCFRFDFMPLRIASSQISMIRMGVCFCFGEMNK
jgi:hypothetical protein